MHPLILCIRMYIKVLGGKKDDGTDNLALYRFEPSDGSWATLTETLTAGGQYLAAIPVLAEWFP